jgi:hypothetical protein
MNVYIVSLDGGGDLFVKIVNGETYNWITSDDPGRPAECGDTSWEDQLVPRSQIEKLKQGNNYPLYITSGSWENDRAIHARSADGYGDYDTIRDALRAINNKGDELIDEYHGCFY